MSNKRSFLISLFLTIFLLIFFGYRYIGPFGKIVRYEFSSKLPGVKTLTSFSLEGENLFRISKQVLAADSARFSVNLASPDIRTVRTKLRFAEGPEEIKLGIKGRKTDDFFYQSLYSSKLQDLNWDSIEKNGVKLWQRYKKYNDIQTFVNNPPQGRETVMYGADCDALWNMKTPDFSKEDNLVIDTPLYGYVRFLIRVDKQPLILKIIKEDINAYEGEDKYGLTVTTWEGNKVLLSERIEDDGTTEATGDKGRQQERIIRVDNIGSFRIVQVDLDPMEGKLDSLITRIEVNQKKLVFLDLISPWGNDPSLIWTTAETVSIVAKDKDYLQGVLLDDGVTLRVKSVNEKQLFNLKELGPIEKRDNIHKLELPKSGLRIKGNGLFVLSEDSYFNPTVVNSPNFTDLNNLEGINYILLPSNLQIEKKDRWLTSEIYFDPKKFNLNGDKLYFSLEVVGLPKYSDGLEVDYLEVEIQHGGVLEEGLASVIPSVAYTELFTKETPEEPLEVMPEEREDFGIQIQVLNGGAPPGKAGEFATVLRNANFTNVVAADADRYDYKNVTVYYGSNNDDEASIVKKLLQESYLVVNLESTPGLIKGIKIIIGMQEF